MRSIVIFITHLTIKRLSTVFIAKYIRQFCIVLLIVTRPVQASEQFEKPLITLDMKAAIRAAKLRDPWLVSNKHIQNSIDAMSIAAGSLPDPTISLGINNLPTGDFNFGQEAMTNAKIGISQMFPAGDTLALKQRQLELKASQSPHRREERKAKVTVTVGQLWLNAYNAQETIKIIEKNIPLFKQLVDITESSYSTALGKTRQQDVIRAQLELTRLDDRLTGLHQKQELFQKRLSEWLNGYFVEGQNSENWEYTSDFSPTRHLPNLKLINPNFYTSSAPVSQAVIFEKMSEHPALLALDQKVRARQVGIDLARQKYKPAWGVNAGYSHRSSDRIGVKRSDLFSVGVSFSVPLFTANRQDKLVQSAMSKASAVKVEKWQVLRKFMATFETVKSQLLRLNERQGIFQSRLLPQMSEQADASLTAYTNDDGDFAEVIRARIAEMNTEIKALNIDVERQKTILQLNYLFMTNSNEIIPDIHPVGDIK